MEARPDIGLDSYDRFFPNQDTLPKGGFGNLIALPLQKKARSAGNSIFVNENLAAYEDQWAFISNLRKIDRTEIENIVQSAEAKGRVVGVRLEIADDDNLTPWNKPSAYRDSTKITGDLPDTLNLVVGNEIYLEKNELSSSLKNHLIRLAAFQNPEFYKAQAMRLPVYDKPRIISCAHEYTHHIGLPRGCMDDLLRLLSDLKIKFTIQNELTIGEALPVNFIGNLRPEQNAAAEAMLSTDIGVLSATTAFG
jgi:hypothetical protein